MRKTLSQLQKFVEAGSKLSMLTCYEASFAGLMDKAEIDIILVGDSLGMLVQGHDSTLPVKVQDIEYHTACVAKGNHTSWIIADMPFGSYQESPAQALHNAVLLMQAGAQMVKLEGGAEMAPTIEFLTRHGIPVCAHIGLVPQQVHALGGYKVQGKTQDSVERLLRDAHSVEEAGAAMMVIEAVPESVTQKICETVSLMTIGIGAGACCDGQVLVMQDMLGMSARPARFVKNFLAEVAVPASIVEAFKAYNQAVKAGDFPTDAHTYAVEPTSNQNAKYG